MPPVASRMVPLGTSAPAFDLPATRGDRVSLDSLGRPKAILVAFICNHCPFVKHIRDELGRLDRDFRGRGLAMVGICSNDPDRYPQDGFAAMAVEARDAGWDFPYLHDAEQSVAKAYRAACTPDFFLFDGERRLVYRGQLDDSRPGNGKPVTGADLRAAIEGVLAGRPAPVNQVPVNQVPVNQIPVNQVPSIGCSIKWKPGHEPASD